MLKLPLLIPREKLFKYFDVCTNISIDFVLLVIISSARMIFFSFKLSKDGDFNGKADSVKKSFGRISTSMTFSASSSHESANINRNILLSFLNDWIYSFKQLIIFFSFFLGSIHYYGKYIVFVMFFLVTLLSGTWISWTVNAKGATRVILQYLAYQESPQQLVHYQGKQTTH